MKIGGPSFVFWKLYSWMASGLLKVGMQKKICFEKSEVFFKVRFTKFGSKAPGCSFHIVMQFTCGQPKTKGNGTWPKLYASTLHPRIKLQNHSSS
jgi:hypothetical protein